MSYNLFPIAFEQFVSCWKSSIISFARLSICNIFALDQYWVSYAPKTFRNIANVSNNQFWAFHFTRNSFPWYQSWQKTYILSIERIYLPIIIVIDTYWMRFSKERYIDTWTVFRPIISFWAITCFKLLLNNFFPIQKVLFYHLQELLYSTFCH